jgi:16S rRNA processing protein RimM
LVCLGVVTGARGLRGEVRVKSFTEATDGLSAYGPLTDESGARSFDARVVGRAGGDAVVRLSGVGDRTAALALKGTRLCVPRRALPPPPAGEYYRADLIGLAVELAGGGRLGTVRAVHDFGAGALIEVRIASAGRASRSVMIPFTARAVPLVDAAAGRIVVDPPAGLLADPPASGRRRRRNARRAKEGSA